MKKFFDSRRELVSVGPGSGGGGGSSGVGGNFIGRTFTIGHHQVTVEETLAEGQDDQIKVMVYVGIRSDQGIYQELINFLNTNVRNDEPAL